MVEVDFGCYDRKKQWSGSEMQINSRFIFHFFVVGLPFLCLDKGGLDKASCGLLLCCSDGPAAGVVVCDPNAPDGVASCS
jgi:hypothetical protein